MPCFEYYAYMRFVVSSFSNKRLIFALFLYSTIRVSKRIQTNAFSYVQCLDNVKSARVFHTKSEIKCRPPDWPCIFLKYILMKRPYLHILALSVINKIIKTRAVYSKYKVMVCEMAKRACVCIFFVSARTYVANHAYKL